MIAIVYTGFKRFYEHTEKNHQRLKNRIRELTEINEYWFTKPNKERPFCVYDQHDARGAIQVFDLVWALDNIKENTFIKLRTDIWLSDDSIDTIISELKLILDNKQDLSLLGWHFNGWDFNKPYGKMTVAEASKHTQDYIVIAKKQTIADKETIFERMNSRAIEKLYTGNKIIRDLVLNRDTSFTVKTHMYLIRPEVKNFNEYDICMEFCKSFGGKGKAEEYTNWFISNKQHTKNNIV